MIRLIEDWRRAHKLASVKVAFAGTLFTSVGVAASYATSAMAFLPVLSFRAVCAVCLGIFVCVIVGRVLNFKEAAKPDDTDQAGA